ncbi:hypothetical protein LY76DRAFT_384491 [Colletotrichum caudatum]|nr:hypothetical protein LY76DRAFT_384491 [Colletotrichum caudatum]
MTSGLVNGTYIGYSGDVIGLLPPGLSAYYVGIVVGARPPSLSTTGQQLHALFVPVRNAPCTAFPDLSALLHKGPRPTPPMAWKWERQNPPRPLLFFFSPIRHLPISQRMRALWIPQLLPLPAAFPLQKPSGGGLICNHTLPVLFSLKLSKQFNHLRISGFAERDGERERGGPLTLISSILKTKKKATRVLISTTCL